MRVIGIAAVAAVLLAAACTGPNPNFCCLSADSCAQAGGSPTSCTDPARPYCTDNIAGNGPLFTCVADPLAQACTGPGDCTTERPFCVDQMCRQCQTSADCPVETPACGDGTFLCGTCEGDGDCVDHDGTPRCLTTSGGCVACLDSNDCSGDTPFCDGNACRACQADDECASNVCDRETGSCVDENDVIYLSTTGTTGGTCTSGAPCNSFLLGLMQVTSSRNVIKAAPGTYTGQVVIDGDTVTIYGEGATVMQTAVQPAIIVINGAVVSIDGLTVSGGGVGIQCSPGTGAAPTLRLHRGKVIANAGGGISISDCQFSLVDDIIALNGGVTTSLGGVSIAQISSITGPEHEFQFNTVTANGGADGSITGVECVQIVGALPFTSNIVYGNQVSGGGTQVGGDSDCTWSYSDIGPDPISGTGNLNMVPMFVDGPNRNYHLQSGSPCQNAADPAATFPVDLDGEPRPGGAADDLGADEITP